MLQNNKSHHHTYGGGGAGLKKGPWSAAEDAILTDYVRRQGEGNWNAVQRNTPLRRCGKSCRLRWANHLRPNLKKGAFSSDEERVIVELHSKLGNKWARISSHLPGRTDNEVKNYWNTRVKRRLRHGLPLYPNTTLQNLTSSSSSPSPSPSSPPPLSSSTSPSSRPPPPPIPLFKITPPSLSFFNPITIPFHPPPTTTTTSLLPTFHPPPPPPLLSPPPPPFVNHHYRCFSSTTQLNPFEDVVQKKSGGGGPVGLGFYKSNYSLDGQTTATTQIETESSSSFDPFGGTLGFHEPDKTELPSNQFCPQLLSANGYDQEQHRAEDGGGGCPADVVTVEVEGIPNYEDRRGNSGLLDALLQEARCRARGERVKIAAAASVEYGGGGCQLDGSTFDKSLGGTMKKEQLHSNSMMTMMNVVHDDELSNIFSLIPSFVPEREWCDDGQEASIVTDDNLAFDQLPPLTHFSVDGEDEWAGGSFNQQIGTTACQGLVQNSYASF